MKYLKISFIAVLLFIISTATMGLRAQIRGNNITITIAPDHKDWNYKTGEKAVFTVSVLRSGTLLDGVKVDYEMGPEFYPNVKKSGVVLKSGTTQLSGSMKVPGFYRLTVRAEIGGKTYESLCTASFSPEKIQPSTVNPADFDAFWRETLDEARKNVPLRPQMTLLPERSNTDVSVYEVSFSNNQYDSRTYGILSVPTKEGKYPALLRVPGAGVRPYEGDTYTAPKGLIVLEIGIHGVPVTMKQQVYDNLAQGALNGYWNFGLNNRYYCYYRRVIVGAVRAIDFLDTLQKWNHEKLGVTGSSQGGFLSYAVAALDKRVTCYGAVHPALCDHTASLGNVACGWPHYFYYDKSLRTKENIETSRYYDGVNFARRVTCPGWISFGYNDVVVPPTTSFATYNSITAPKTLSVYQQTGHYWYQEQWDEWLKWLKKELDVKE